MLYSIVRAILGVLANALFRVKVTGASNIPSEGPVVICANHISWWDPVIVCFAVKRKVHFMAKKELFKNPVLAYLLRKVHAFPVNRGKQDLGAIKAGLSVLKNGEVLGIFPEGTRQRNGDRLGEMRAGAALFAIKTGAAVVPAAIRGTYKIGRPISLAFGESFTLDAKTGRSAFDIEQGAQVIGKAISGLWNTVGEESRVLARGTQSC